MMSVKGATSRWTWRGSSRWVSPGARANIGRVEAVVAGRPDSWEAEGVCQLLWSTIDDDDQPLGHRTEPVVVDVDGDEILVDLGVWAAHDKAKDEIYHRDDASTVTMSEPPTPERQREFDALSDLYDPLKEERIF